MLLRFARVTGNFEMVNIINRFYMEYNAIGWVMLSEIKHVTVRPMIFIVFITATFDRIEWHFVLEQRNELD